MLSNSELRHWVDHFEVPEQQIRRDHLLSHALRALAALDLDVVFFGGTALCRTHLLDWRLSEDIDLLTEEVQETARTLESVLPRHLRREYPGSTLALERDAAGRTGVLRAGDTAIHVQIVASDARYPRYPTSITPVSLRYEDLPRAVDLTTPTLVGAAAMKLSAWADRGAPRDLCDLYGLAMRGLLDHEAVQVAADVGTPPAAWMYADTRAPSPADWHAALSHQMADVPAASTALSVVRDAVFR